MTTTPALDRDTLATWLDRVDSAPDGERDLYLVFADWLEEQGDHSRAEYIRAGVELASVKGELDPNCEGLKRRSDRCGSYVEMRTRKPLPCKDCWASLRSRRAALLAANREQWCAMPCPGCGGKGRVAPSDRGHPTDGVCPACSGSGDVFAEPPRPGLAAHPGPFSRIDPARDFYAHGLVPFVWSVATELGGVGREILCPECEGYSSRCRGSECACGGRFRVFRPTPFALAVVRHCPSVRGFRVTDREPYHWRGEASWSRESWGHGSDVLPDCLYHRLEGGELRGENRSMRTYPTSAAAESALWTLLVRLSREAK